MAKRATLILFGFALYLVICGLSPLFVIGFDMDQHFHGIRLAAVIGLCGFFASRFKKSPALAVLAMDSAGLLMLGTSLNYARLANNWYGMDDVDWYSPYQAGAMAVGGFLALWFLVLTRPKSPVNCGEWWRPTPLITVPALLILPITRRRHGLGFSRRIVLASGALLLIVGFVFSMSHRFPQMSVAQIIKYGKFAQENEELIRIAMSEPDLVAKLLEDPGNVREIIKDPRAMEILEKLSADGGILEGVDTQAMAQSIANGNFQDLNEILKDSNISGAEELLALASEGDSPLGDLLGEEGTKAAKELSARLASDGTTLAEALNEDDGTVSRKLLTTISASNGNDSENRDMDELMQKLTASIDPQMLKQLQGAGHIDLNDPKVQSALREMNINPQDASKLLAQSSTSNGAASELLGAANSNPLSGERANANKVSPNKLASRIATIQLNTRVSVELDKSELSDKQPRLFFTPVADSSQPIPFAPINIAEINSPQQDFLTKRINQVRESSSSNGAIVVASNPNEAGIQELTDASGTFNVVTAVSIDDGSASTSVSTRKSETHSLTNNAQASASTARNFAKQLGLPFEDTNSAIGLLCMILGLVAVSASLSRR